MGIGGSNYHLVGTTILFNFASQKVIQSIKVVPSGIKIGKEQLNIVAYVDGIVLPYFSIDNAHLMYNAHTKLFRHSF